MERQKSTLKQIHEKVTKQDTNQRLNVTILVTLEFYRVLVSSLLILFVPQKCQEHVCTLSENMETESKLYTAGLAINFITLAVFLTMYALEVKR